MSETSTTYKCVKDLYTQDGHKCFTQGRLYEAHPYLSDMRIQPGAVIFVNDNLDNHVLSPDFLAEYFERLENR